MAGVKKIIGNQITGSCVYILQTDGTVKACGRNNSGQLGLGDMENRNTFTTIPALYDVIDVISDCANYVYFLLKDGSVKACGYNENGCIGVGDTENRMSPSLLPDLSDVKEIFTSDYSTFFLMKDGTVKSCGGNSRGCLGLGDTISRSIATKIEGLSGVVAIRANTFFIMEDGSVKACGSNSFYGLGFEDGADRTIPETIPGAENVKDVFYSNSGTFFLLNDGTVKGCGRNWGGCLGVNSGEKVPVPTLIPKISNLKKLVSINGSTYFFTASDSNKDLMTVYACGRNNNGQLFLGNYIDQNSPIGTKFGSNFYTDFEVISGTGTNANNSTSVYLLREYGGTSTLYSFGKNNAGQLGVGDTFDQYTKMQVVQDIVKPKSIIPLANSAVAIIEDDGTVKVCGNNQYGSLGLGDNKNRTRPEVLSGFAFGVKYYFLYLKGDACYAEENKSLLQIATNWSTLAAAEKKVLFDSATSEMPNISSLSDLGAFKVVAFKENATDMIAPTCRLTAIATDHLVMPKGLIPIQNFEGIDKATLTITTSGQGSCKVLVTTDRTAYQSYDFATQAWKAVDHTDIAAVKANGIDAAQLTNIPRAAWDTLTAGKDGIGFAYLPSIESTSDVCSVDELTLQVDMRGTWERASEADYTYAYPNNTTLRVTLKTDGDYKINYRR